MLEAKATVTKMKNAFSGLISRLDTTEERTSEFEDMPISTAKWIIERWKKGDIICENCGITTKGVAYVWWNYQKKRKEDGTGEILEAVTTKYFPKHRPQRFRNTKKNKCQRGGGETEWKTTAKTIPMYHIQTAKSKMLKKILKEARGKRYFMYITYRGTKIISNSQKPCKQEETGIKYLK